MVDVQASETWRAVLGDLQLQVTRPIYDTWLKDTIGLSLTDHCLTVAVPTPFASEWLEKRMSQLIQKTVRKVTDSSVDVQFAVGNNPYPNTSNENEPSTRQPASRLPARTFNKKYSFDNFVVGSCNQLPYSAALAVAEAPGQSYNPLFIYSGVGLGKTHLLHALGQVCVSKGLDVLYVTSEQFTNDFISSIRARTSDEFRNRYRSVEVLLIDDVQFISGKEQTQEGFFHTFNDLHNANRQVVLTSDRPPKAMPLLEDRLRSRFEWGLIADIQPPGLETRMAILRDKAEQMNITLGETIHELIAKRVQKNVRELEGTLNRLVALSQLTQQPITPELATQAISNFLTDPSSRSIESENVLEEVGNRFSISPAALVGPSRKKDIVRARHVAMYLLHEELGLRDTQIGRLLGGRDHSTVINGVGRINHDIDVDPALRQDVLSIKESLFS